MGARTGGRGDEPAAPRPLRARLPWRTLLVVGAALAAGCPPLRDDLDWQRAALERGEIWRLLTGHLVHPTARLAWVDLGVLLVVGAALELRRPRLVVPTALAGALLASLALLLLRPDLARYVGSSALSSALWVALALVLWSEPSPAARLLGALALAGMALKLALELFGPGGAWLSPALGGGAGAGPPLRLAPEAHLFGALGGLVAAAAAGLVPGLRRPRRLA